MRIKKLLQSDGKEISRTEKTLALTLASIVNTMLSLLLSMAAARVLTKTEIAVNSQTFLVYSTFSPFLTLGITSGIYYYLSQNEHRKRAVVNESMVLVLFSSLLFSLFILLGGNQILADSFKNPAISQTLFFMVPYTLLITPASVLSCVLVYENRLRFNAVYNTFQTFAILLITLAAMLFFRTGQSMVVARVFASCAFAVLTAYIIYAVILPQDGSHMKWSSIRALVAISVPLGIASVVGTLSTNLDKWIISTMLTPEIYATYCQGARELPLVGTLTGSINTVMIVDLTKAVKENNYGVALSLFRKVAEKTSLLLMPIMVFCMVAADDVISFLYTDSYAAAVPVFQIYLLYLPIRVVIYSPFLIALGKSKFIMWRTAGSLLINALVSVVCVHLLGAEGAALASILALYFFDVPLNLYVIAKATGAKWTQLLPLRRIIFCILLSLPGAVCGGLVGHLLPGTITAFWKLFIEFTLFSMITLPVFVFCFHLPVRRILERVKEKLAQYIKL